MKLNLLDIGGLYGSQKKARNTLERYLYTGPLCGGATNYKHIRFKYVSHACSFIRLKGTVKTNNLTQVLNIIF